MSRSANKLISAAAGAGGDATYVDDVFSTFVYEGNGSTRTITNGIDLSGEDGMVWLKGRTTYKYHRLIRNDNGTLKSLSSNVADAENSNPYITSFNANGFTLGSGSQTNQSGEDYVSWTFRKQPGFFDIVTYTGNGTFGRSISHNLGSVPGMILVKSTSGTHNWSVYHRGSNGGTTPEGYNLVLNSTAAQVDSNAFWADTAPTSTTFTVGSGGAVNSNGETYIAYLFAHDAQDFGEDSDEAIIKCGSFTGNPTTIDLGFEPQWMIAKKYDSTSPWQMFDNMRGWTANGGTKDLEADTSSAETDRTSQNYTQLKSTGVTFNSYGGSWIYMAIARPHKPASEFAATALLGLDKPTSGGKPTPGFPADFGFAKNTTGIGIWYVGSRLTQGFYNNFSSTSAESSASGYSWDSMTQFFHGYTWADYMTYGFRRAPGFMDVVVYKGTNSATTISHNLGVAPEMIFLKNRGATEDWQLYLNAGGVEYGYYGTNQKYVGLNTSLSPWNDTSPTNSAVSISSSLSNASYSYVMYLFASVSGISKIGTYTGTGSELAVDCGFSAGARFVLITRVDSSMGSGGESWFLFDTVQGITASSSPYFVLNDSDAPVTGSFIKPDSSGFKVTSQSVVNTSGKTYVFYAIA